MATLGVIFDLGHTLMGLDGTWPEMFENGALNLTWQPLPPYLRPGLFLPNRW